jgi:hypothetical protein
MQASGSVADLLRHIPTLLDAGLIPPLPVVNSILVTGVSDAGMGGGCEWPPFTLEESEYADVVAELVAHGDLEGGPLRDGEAPQWVESRLDWFIWVCFKRQGIPVDEHRSLHRELNEVEMARERATATNDYARVDELLSREHEIMLAINRLLLKHIPS